MEALGRTLHDIRIMETAMGGTTVILAEDIRQMLLVVPTGTGANEVEACLKFLYLWPNVKILSFKKI